MARAPHWARTCPYYSNRTRVAPEASPGLGFRQSPLVHSSCLLEILLGLAILCTLGLCSNGLRCGCRLTSAAVRAR